ncbi:MAG: phenylacetate-CoA oxygenase subunit PaaC [Frankiaceae bacterium]|nr:phenylacetate-CoA oxygenase subunit PaaC [Frankiaceae bacterium]
MGDHAVEALLRVGDSCLVLAQRLTAWCGHAPALEEDIALANIALDILGQARGLLTRTGEIEGAGRDEDALAYLRDAPDYRNVLLVEQPNGDYGHTMLRQFLFDAWAVELWPRLASSSDPVVAGIAGKAAKEAAYHVRHSSTWVVRLGDGTEESHHRMLAALDMLWPYTGEAFLDDEVDVAAAESALMPLPSSLLPAYRHRVEAVLADATLPVPPDPWWQRGGRQGSHSEHLTYLLADMQVVHRAHPGASW